MSHSATPAMSIQRGAAQFGRGSVAGSPVQSGSPPSGTLACPVQDEYGFVNKFACSREAYLAFRERYRASKGAMEQRWKRLCSVQTTKGAVAAERAQSAAAGTALVFAPFGPGVKKAARLGIPSHLRPAAWLFYSGGAALQAQQAQHGSAASFYEGLLMQPKPAAFYLLADRMKVDFVDVLPTNQIVRRDYFGSSHALLGAEGGAPGRVRIIPDRAETPEAVARPRRLSCAPEPAVPARSASLSPPYHAQHAAAPFLARLYNVLVALVTHRPGVEYCRALCTVAATLLLVIQDEEKTFWTLSALFSNYGDVVDGGVDAGASGELDAETIVFEDFRISDAGRSVSAQVHAHAPGHAPGHPHGQSHGQSHVQPHAHTHTHAHTPPFKYFPDTVFRDTGMCAYASLDGFTGILARKRPQLAAQLQRLEVPVALITTTWFQSLFLDVLPTESSMRVMDAFIAEGFKVLYRVALALFLMHEQEILQTVRSHGRASAAPAGSAAAAVLQLLKQLPKRQVVADALLHYAFNDIGSLSMDAVLRECALAASQETPLRSIRRFSQAPETQLTMRTVRRLSVAMQPVTGPGESQPPAPGRLR